MRADPYRKCKPAPVVLGSIICSCSPLLGRIIPVSKRLVTPMYKPWKSHLEEKQESGTYLSTTCDRWDDPPSTTSKNHVPTLLTGFHFLHRGWFLHCPFQWQSCQSEHETTSRTYHISQQTKVVLYISQVHSMYLTYIQI